MLSALDLSQRRNDQPPKGLRREIPLTGAGFARSHALRRSIPNERGFVRADPRKRCRAISPGCLAASGQTGFGTMSNYGDVRSWLEADFRDFRPRDT